MSLIDILLVFPPDHLVRIINLTNRKLCTSGCHKTLKGEIVKFFGNIVLST